MFDVSFINYVISWEEVVECGGREREVGEGEGRGNGEEEGLKARTFIDAIFVRSPWCLMVSNTEVDVYLATCAK